jgi:hypothetical protein
MSVFAGKTDALRLDTSRFESAAFAGSDQILT